MPHDPHDNPNFGKVQCSHTLEGLATICDLPEDLFKVDLFALDNGAVRALINPRSLTLPPGSLRTHHYLHLLRLLISAPTLSGTRYWTTVLIKWVTHQTMLEFPPFDPEWEDGHNPNHDHDLDYDPFEDPD